MSNYLQLRSHLASKNTAYFLPHLRKVATEKHTPFPSLLSTIPQLSYCTIQLVCPRRFKAQYSTQISPNSYAISTNERPLIAGSQLQVMCVLILVSAFWETQKILAVNIPHIFLMKWKVKLELCKALSLATFCRW